MAATENDWRALQFADGSLKSNRRIVLAAVQQEMSRELFALKGSKGWAAVSKSFFLKQPVGPAVMLGSPTPETCKWPETCSDAQSYTLHLAILTLIHGATIQVPHKGLCVCLLRLGGRMLFW